MKQRNELMKEIQNIWFAMYDLLLYLDTHPCDKKAFRMFKELGEKKSDLYCEYVNNYGPLTAFDTAERSSFDWLNSPWPWEHQTDSKQSGTPSCGCAN